MLFTVTRAVLFSRLAVLVLLTLPLYLPEDVASEGAGTVGRFDISIAARPMVLSGTSAKFAHAAPLTDGGTIVAWNSGPTAWFRRLDRNNRTIGSDFSVSDLYLVEVRTFGDATLHILGFEMEKGRHLGDAFSTDQQLFYIRADLNGRILLKRSIVGGQGTGPGRDWHYFYTLDSVHIEFDGREYAIFTIISHNWAKNPGDENTHQGDVYFVLDRNGVIQHDQTQHWNQSHSSDIKLTSLPGKGFYTLTSADGSLALYAVHRFSPEQNRTPKTERVVWPDFVSKEERRRLAADNLSTTGAGRVDAFFPTAGGELVMVARTSTDLPLMKKSKVEVPANVLVVKLDADLKTTKKAWLTTGNTNVQAAFGHRFGDRILVGWSMTSTKASRATLLLLDNDLNHVSRFADSDAFISADAKPFSYPNGDVGWVTCTDDGTQIILNRFSAATTSIGKAANDQLIAALRASDTRRALNALQQGADPNAKDRTWSALLLAIYYDNLEIARALVERGANVNFEVQGYNALALANVYRRNRIAAYLKRKGAAASRSRALKPRPPR